MLRRTVFKFRFVFVALPFVLFVLGVAPGLAEAHTAGVSAGKYVATGRKLEVSWSFAASEAAREVPGLDADRDGTLSPRELASGRDVLVRTFVERTIVTADGAPCEGGLGESALLEADGISIAAAYTCPEARRLEVKLSWFGALTRGHRHLARLEGIRSEDRLIEAKDPAFEIEPRVSVEGPAAAKPDQESKTFFGFVAMGGEHILGGYDHLAFLLGLLLVPIAFRSAAWAVTAFTVAHSITLAIAASGLFVPSPRFTEPLIALSIAYVAAENLWRKTGEKRARLTFVFGLVHGFGFAGALRALSLGRSELPRALFGFNLGVELGQLAVMVVFFFAVRRLERLGFFRDRGRTALNVVLALAGAILFLQRIVYAA